MINREQKNSSYKMQRKILIMLSLMKFESLQSSCYKNQEDVSSHYRQEH